MQVIGIPDAVPHAAALLGHAPTMRRGRTGWNRNAGTGPAAKAPDQFRFFLKILAGEIGFPFETGADVDEGGATTIQSSILYAGRTVSGTHCGWRRLDAW